ncbi:MAG: hypothetical protein IKP66_06815, partial [Lachnospiraceae bacterium]|nr:hypothetical protein [Lachnospiraceae bacterium]
ELLLWGYTGLDEFSTTVNNVNDVLAQGLESELQQEQANASKELKAHQEVDYQQGVENAEKMMEPATMDDLLKMCGTLAK